MIPSPAPSNSRATLLRRRIERRSAAPLIALNRFPRSFVVVVIAGLCLGGLLADGALSAVLLLGTAAILSWVGYLSWPALTAPARVLRILTILAVMTVVAAPH
jgi:hypothetical protein